MHSMREHNNGYILVVKGKSGGEETRKGSAVYKFSS